ncbi:MAG: low affinity iron permease family protein [Proteobacteria bacterium]|nr:MAG: low affinity iron permease family protein [Pseudomonadota bacterium]
MKDRFRKFAKVVADWTGSPTAFGFALFSVILWATTGPLFHYSEEWQLVINTGTTIITFLMVFLIQNLQNRDSQILHLKIDELIRTDHKARNDLLDLDEKSDEALAELHNEFLALKISAEKDLERVLTSQKKRSRTF